MYTGARFSNPPTKEEAKVLAACSRIVLRDYVCLSIEELDEAFSLASSGQFEGINIETYYGEFTPQILGRILKSYLVYRRKVLGVHNEQMLLLKYEAEKLSQQQKDDLQEKAKEQIVSQYIDIVFKFNEGIEEFNIEKDIKASWIKPLIEMGIVVFDLDEKREIHAEAKAYVINKLKAEMHNKKNNFHKLQSIKFTLRRIQNQEKDTDYEAKVIARYSKLLILKSITKL